MRFLEHAGLNRLSVLLDRLDVGDRVIQGKLELFTTAARLSSEKSLCENIERELCHTPQWLSSPVLKRDGKELLFNLVSTMNQCFPDYDFSSLSPHMFHCEPNLEVVYSHINYNLSYIAERIFPGFLDELWTNIKDAIELENIDVYSYKGGVEVDPFTDENCLCSFDYFFYCRNQRRILFFSCMTKNKDLRPLSDNDAEYDCSDYMYNTDTAQRTLNRDDSESFDDLELTPSPYIY